MTSYYPPTASLPTFNPAVFNDIDDTLTFAEADKRYLIFPQSQGNETINGTLTTTGLATLASANVVGSLTAGTFAPTTINCNTLNATSAGANQTIGNNLTTGGLNVGNNITTNNINIGASLTTGNVNINKGAGGGVGIANLNGLTSTAVEICNGASAFNTSTCVIGKNSALSINNSTGSVNLSTTSQTNGTLTIANEASSNRTINIGRNNAITVNNAATSVITLTGTTNINTGGVASTNIGNGTGTTTITGTINMNDNVSLGSTSADTLTPNGTLSKPLIIGYSLVSSFSASSATPVSTYLGGTLQSSMSVSSVATNNFSYPFSSITPYSAGGGLTLPTGTYMFWYAINMEDAVSFDITDLRMGITTTSTLSSASTEANYVGGLPNLSCYFHKTDAGAAAVADSENRVLSGCFCNTLISAVYYPFWYINTTVTLDTVKADIIFVKIGSGN